MQLIKMVALDKSTHTKKGQTMKSNNIKPVQKKKTHMPLGVCIAFGAMAAVAGMSSASCENPTEVIVEKRQKPEFYQVFFFDVDVSQENILRVKDAYNVLTKEEAINLKDNFLGPLLIDDNTNLDDTNINFIDGIITIGGGVSDIDFTDKFLTIVRNYMKDENNKFSDPSLALGRKLDSAKQTVRISMGKMRQGRMI
jgi:hypothetical protein